jgi:hypothetical protein
MFSLNAEDDDGETAAGRGKYDKQAAKENNNPPAPPEKKEAEGEKIGKAEIVNITCLIQQLDEVSSGSFRGWIKKAFNADSIQDIPKAGFEKCMVSLNAKIKYLKDQERVAV